MAQASPSATGPDLVEFSSVLTSLLSQENGSADDPHVRDAILQFLEDTSLSVYGWQSLTVTSDGTNLRNDYQTATDQPTSYVRLPEHEVTFTPSSGTACVASAPSTTKIYRLRDVRYQPGLSLLDKLSAKGVVTRTENRVDTIRLDPWLQISYDRESRFIMHVAIEPTNAPIRIDRWQRWPSRLDSQIPMLSIIAKSQKAATHNPTITSVRAFLLNPTSINQVISKEAFVVAAPAKSRLVAYDVAGKRTVNARLESPVSNVKKAVAETLEARGPAPVKAGGMPLLVVFLNVVCFSALVIWMLKRQFGRRSPDT